MSYDRFERCVLKLYEIGFNDKQILGIMGSDEVINMLSDNEHPYSFCVNGIWIHEWE